MAIPKIKEQDIMKALTYIDENGVPVRNQSTKYELVSDDGKRYPPKYVVAVAAHIATGAEITTEDFNADEARAFLEAQGFNIETKQREEFRLSVTAAGVVSTDARFTMNNLSLGDRYEPLDTYFRRADGSVVRRSYSKGERRNSNQTMPRIACQLFEKQLSALSVEDKENFPVCRYNPNSPMICGIYSGESEFKKYRNTIEFLKYNCDDGRQLVIYCWNIFSTLIFVQECLKRFGQPGDEFVLIYREKEENETETAETETAALEESVQPSRGYRNRYSSMLIASKNLIFHGAPGTGKSYLAKQIAADIITNGESDKYASLTDEQKKQVEFVQFHPSYDYSDFVEGLRPVKNADGSIGFDLKDGIFKKFVTRARENFENSRKSQEEIEKELSVQEAMEEFFSNIEFEETTFKTKMGKRFSITDVDEKHISISIPENTEIKKLRLSLDRIRQMLESGEKFEQVKDIWPLFGNTHNRHEFSYEFVIYHEILKQKKQPSKSVAKAEELKKYIFIIDEINRGEISKIFGELFYAIDPGYRGKDGEISTQYANLHDDPDEKFYIPENVYIIGTMNDIDRSVDSFDFAMRRRFRFVELRANEHLEMLATLGDKAREAEERMKALNEVIAAVDDLNESYQIGASYFLKLKDLDFDQLWTDYLMPLLKEYIRGISSDEKGLMNRFKKAYYGKTAEGDGNEPAQD